MGASASGREGRGLNGAWPGLTPADGGLAPLADGRRHDGMTGCYGGPACRQGPSPVNALLHRISIDPAICGGKPCIKGTRLWVSLILDFLPEGMTEAELLSDYSQLTHQDVMAAIAYGAEMSRERILPVPLARVA